ncbi:MAG: C-GCAxxG-C-C family protein [Anaeromyxobacter sp.]
MRAAGPGLRARSLGNLLRMGHCAPSVMKSAAPGDAAQVEWLVRLCAGLPGGIGNSRHECGGVTAPLLLLGLDHADEPDEQGVPAVLDRAYAFVQAFRARHGTLLCQDILGARRLPLPCIPVVTLAAERYVRLTAGARPEGLTGERREACALFCGHLAGRGFHCARAVLASAPVPTGRRRMLHRAAAAFVGGTALEGLTCGALTAGVLSIGLAAGEIEDSPLRVLRMVGTMATGGNAFAEDLNAFNRAMNLGHALVRWFLREHGSTQCRVLTRCDLGTLEGARRYVDTRCVERCEALAAGVASRVRAMIEA